MTKTDFFLKRMFDIVFSIIGLLLFSPLIFLCWMIAAMETRSNGFFIHQRVGRYGKTISVYKIKTMYPTCRPRSSLTVHNMSSITRSGAFFRKYKLDELPQLFNVLFGSMSFVGPRPDVPGYADRLEGSNRIILRLRPGITGPASLKYKNEESLLSRAADPALYNDRVIWPDKVRINKEYFSNYSLLNDLHYIFKTLSR